MTHLVALLVFAALAGTCWFVAAACYRSTFDDADPVSTRAHRTAVGAAVGAVALTSFVQFPLGYVAGLVVWAAAAFGGVGLPPGRATALFLYLAAASFAERLVVLGILSLLGP